MKLFRKRNTTSTGDMFIRAEGESFEDFTKRAWREAEEEVKSESIARERRELRNRHRSTNHSRRTGSATHAAHNQCLHKIPPLVVDCFYVRESRDTERKGAGSPCVPRCAQRDGLLLRQP
jgi:hypothetical protein